MEISIFHNQEFANFYIVISALSAALMILATIYCKKRPKLAFVFVLLSAIIPTFSLGYCINLSLSLAGSTVMISMFLSLYAAFILSIIIVYKTQEIGRLKALYRSFKMSTCFYFVFIIFHLIFLNISM